MVCLCKELAVKGGVIFAWNLNILAKLKWKQHNQDVCTRPAKKNLFRAQSYGHLCWAYKCKQAVKHICSILWVSVASGEACTTHQHCGKRPDFCQRSGKCWAVWRGWQKGMGETLVCRGGISLEMGWDQWRLCWILCSVSDLEDQHGGSAPTWCRFESLFCSSWTFFGIRGWPLILQWLLWISNDFFGPTGDNDGLFYTIVSCSTGKHRIGLSEGIWICFLLVITGDADESSASEFGLPNFQSQNLADDDRWVGGETGLAVIWRPALDEFKSVCVLIQAKMQDRADYLTFSGRTIRPGRVGTKNCKSGVMRQVQIWLVAYEWCLDRVYTLFTKSLFTNFTGNFLFLIPYWTRYWLKIFSGLKLNFIEIGLWLPASWRKGTASLKNGIVISLTC